MKSVLVLLLCGVAFGQQSAVKHVLPHRCLAAINANVYTISDSELSIVLTDLLECAPVNGLTNGQRAAIVQQTYFAGWEQASRQFRITIQQKDEAIAKASSDNQQTIKELVKAYADLSKENAQLSGQVSMQNSILHAIAAQQVIAPQTNSDDTAQLEQLNSTAARIEHNQRMQMLDDPPKLISVPPPPPTQIFCNETKTGVGPFASTVIACQ